MTRGCPGCGHSAEHARMVRGLLSRLLGVPARAECRYELRWPEDVASELEASTCFCREGWHAALFTLA